MVRTIFDPIQDTVVLCTCHILLKYVLLEQNAVLQVDISSFMHLGLKFRKKRRYLEIFNIYTWYILRTMCLCIMYT